MLSRILFFLINFLLCANLYSAGWNFYVQDNVLFLNFKPGANEKIHWVYGGTVGQPTKIDLSKSENLGSYEILWPWPKIETIDKDNVNYVYSSNTNIPVLLTSKDKTQPIKIVVEISYVVCGNDSCSVQSSKFSDSILIADEKNRDFSSQVIVNSAKILDDRLILNITSKRKLTTAKFLLTDEENFVMSPSKIDSKRGLATIYFDLPNKFKVSGLKLFSNKSDIAAPINIKKTISIYTALFLAFLGGLILNFMPCVLPVLSLKMLSLIKFSESKYRVRILFTLIGIIGTFLCFSIFSIICKNTGNHFGFGFHMQNTPFLIGVSVVITFLISVALGRVRLGNVTKFATTAVSFNYIGDVLLGIISTLLATPCTAPFLGTALAFAMTQGDIENIFIFLFIGLGFGSPYLLALISYDFIRFIPKSGPWLQKFKLILSYLLVLSLLWVLYVLYTQLGLRATIGFTLILIVLKFFIEHEKMAFLSRALLIIVLIGFSFYLPQTAAEQDHKYQSTLQKLWHPFEPEKIKAYVDQGKVVIVDVTASWCSYCQVNKLVVWNRSWTAKLLNNKNIISMRADITNNDELSQHVYKFMSKHKISGIPLTVIYGPRAPQGIVIEDVLTYDHLRSIIEKVKE